MRKKRYGPYKMATGHLFWVDLYEDGKQKSVMVHREKVEESIGRALTANEVVHHIDEDPSNNDLSNLQIKSPSQHVKDHHPKPQLVTVSCSVCGEVVSKRANHVKHNRKQGKRGPFCGKSCAGSWARKKQLEAGINVTVGSFHGTATGYRYRKCRCFKCRAAHAEEARRQRSSRNIEAQQI